MTKVKIQIGDKWGEFYFNHYTLKTAQDIFMRLPKNQRTPGVFLHHIIYEPRLSLYEWQNEVPLGVLNRIFMCITESLRKYRSNKKELDDIIDEIEILSLDDKIDEKKLMSLIKKRDKLLEDVKNIEEDDGIIVYSAKEIDRIEKNRNLYI